MDENVLGQFDILLPSGLTITMVMLSFEIAVELERLCDIIKDAQEVLDKYEEAETSIPCVEIISPFDPGFSFFISVSEAQIRQSPKLIVVS